MSSKINFIQLTTKELSNKIALLVLNKARVVFWKITPRYQEGTAVSFNENKLILKTSEMQLKIVGEQVCLNFNLNQMEYFVKGKVLSQIEEREELEVELFENCFRVEKRDFQRVQVYPYYDVYAYLKYTEQKNENVFFLNKNEQKKNDLFANLKEVEKQKIIAISNDLQTDTGEDLRGFRVEDLSSNGLCFLASQKENEQIISQFVNKNFNLVLVFGSNTYQLGNAQIIYQVSYISQQFAGASMFKVGVTFSEDNNLREKIQILTGHDDKLLDYPKEFEEFIKNEN